MKRVKLIAVVICLILALSVLGGCTVKTEKPVEQDVDTVDEETETEQVEIIEEEEEAPAEEARTDIIRGINYDVGLQYGTRINNHWPGRETGRKELEVIKKDLCCDAVRISGTEITPMVEAMEEALSVGLDVWLSPHYLDYTEEEMVANLLECAKECERCRKEYPDRQITFIVGCELIYFMPGFMEGETFRDRMKAENLTAILLNKDTYIPLNEFFAELVPQIREIFGGWVTYCATEYEDINWELFDCVCIDYYRTQYNRDYYAGNLFVKGVFSHNKPVYITEFGCCAFTGAADNSSSAGMSIRAEDDSLLNGIYERNEKLQADELIASLTDLYDDNQVAGAFVFTFKMDGMPHDEEDPIKDVDMASYGIVKAYTDGRNGTVYPEMNWDPKEAFYAIQEFYSTH